MKKRETTEDRKSRLKHGARSVRRTRSVLRKGDRRIRVQGYPQPPRKPRSVWTTGDSVSKNNVERRKKEKEKKKETLKYIHNYINVHQWKCF